MGNFSKAHTFRRGPMSVEENICRSYEHPVISFAPENWSWSRWKAGQDIFLPWGTCGLSL